MNAGSDAPGRRTGHAPPSPGVLLTRTGAQSLRHELAVLRRDVLPELQMAMAERDRDGRVDLDYHRVRADIARLEDLLDSAGSTRSRPRTGTIGLGDLVTVAVPDGQLQVLVVSPEEAFLDERRISQHSPLAVALAGAGVGDTVMVHAPSGTYPARVLLFSRE